jgi:putative transposase
MERKYHYRRNLPHRQWIRKVFFVTFCTHKREVLTPGSRDMVLETCLVGNGKLFQLHAVVVMPDHVHLMLTPLGDEKCEIAVHEIMQAIKGTSAHRINRYLGRKGKLWQEESFDRAMREVENVRGKIEYILGNPVRAGLVQNPFDYRWLWRESTGGDARASTISAGVTD